MQYLYNRSRKYLDTNQFFYDYMTQIDVLCYIENIFGFCYSYNKTRLTHDYNKNFDRS